VLVDDLLLCFLGQGHALSFLFASRGSASGAKERCASRAWVAG